MKRQKFYDWFGDLVIIDKEFLYGLASDGGTGPAIPHSGHPFLFKIPLSMIRTGSLKEINRCKLPLYINKNWKSEEFLKLFK